MPRPRFHPRRQLALLYAFAWLTYPFACIPFLYFWFRDHGIGVAAWSWLVSAYYLTMVVAEIPTGVLADRYGRRLPLVLGPLTLAAGFATIALGRDMMAFTAGEVLLGLGHALLSGPPSALLYDSLAHFGAEARFLHVEGRLHGLRLLGTGTAFLLGGVLVKLSGIAAAITATALLSVVAAAVATRLDEPPHTRPAKALPIVTAAWREVRQPAVRWLAAYFVLLFCLLRYSFHTYQPYLEESGSEEPLLLGGLFFLLNLAAAPWSRWASTLVGRLGELGMLWWMPLTMSGALLLMAASPGPIGIALFFLHQAPFGVHWAVIQAMANRAVGAGSRTTVLSALSFGGRLVFTAVFPLLGWLQQEYGLRPTYVGVAVVGAAVTLLLMLRRPVAER